MPLGSPSTSWGLALLKKLIPATFICDQPCGYCPQLTLGEGHRVDTLVCVELCLPALLSSPKDSRAASPSFQILHRVYPSIQNSICLSRTRLQDSWTLPPLATILLWHRVKATHQRGCGGSSPVVGVEGHFDRLPLQIPLVYLSLPSMCFNFPCHVIHLSSRWWWADSSAPLFHLMSNGMASDQLIEPDNAMAWCQVLLSTCFC